MILHVDMDAFFASVEQLDNPKLTGKCVIVGGLSGRGVVSAASYEARKFGVHSAMPMFLAKQKCPDGIFLHPRMERYSEISEKIMALLEEFSPLVEPVSIDEAYMDISGCERLHGDPETIGSAIKKKIRDTVCLGCSIGIAPNKFLAKIASDIHKPDGLTIIMPEQALQFAESIPIGKVPGVGKAKLPEFEQTGIKLLGDVKKYTLEMLLNKFGKYGYRLLELSSGSDDSPVIPFSRSKSISCETTLEKNTRDKLFLKKYLLEHAEDIGKQLRGKGLRAKTVVLKIKDSDFRQSTRSITVKTPTHSSRAVYKEAVTLLNSYELDKEVRLIGVGVSGLIPASVPVQINMFDEEKKKNGKWEKVDRALDDIAKKFGKNAVGKAAK
ncbi:MAG: DNA polymerase IV [Proteobacteria bacterium]|nr:DNA polymerase IV [Pseudomonadota bacterium]